MNNNKWFRYLSEISQDQAKEKFGDVLFGSGRYKDEKDTEEESEIFDRLRNWYYGNKPITDQDLNTLIDLYKSGLYLDFLQPPSTDVCRVVATYFDKVKDKVSPIGKVNNEIEVYKINPFTMGFGEYNRKYASWAIEKQGAASFMKSAVASFKSYEKDSVCFYFANTDENKGSFMINPDETKNFSFGYERETFQIDDVKVNGGVCYKLINYSFGQAPSNFISEIEDHFTDNYIQKRELPKWMTSIK